MTVERSVALHEPQKLLGQFRVAYATENCPIKFVIPVRSIANLEDFQEPPGHINIAYAT